MTNTKDKYAELREAHHTFNELSLYKQIEYSQCPIWHKYSSLLLADLDAANSEWISVEDRLPEEGEKVFYWVVPSSGFSDTSGNPILATKPHLHIGTYRSWGALYRATHWMPLPNPPTDKEQV